MISAGDAYPIGSRGCARASSTGRDGADDPHSPGRPAHCERAGKKRKVNELRAWAGNERACAAVDHRGMQSFRTTRWSRCGVDAWGRADLLDHVPVLPEQARIGLMRTCGAEPDSTSRPLVHSSPVGSGSRRGSLEGGSRAPAGHTGQLATYRLHRKGRSNRPSADPAGPGAPLARRFVSSRLAGMIDDPHVDRGTRQYLDALW